MKPENQVCALDQAKKLRELGAVSKSLFYWIDREEQSKLVYSGQVEFLNDLPVYPAFTSAELGEMLPSEVLTEREPGIQMRVWVCSSNDYEVAFPADTEAQAKADMLIWLLQQGYYTMAELEAEYAKA